MERAHHENGQATNPIYGMLVDHQAVEQVFRHVQSLDDVRLANSKSEVAAAYRRIEDRCVPPNGQENADGWSMHWRGLSAEELASFSRQAMDDVCQFVTAAIVCFRSVSTIRPLTAEEKRHGQALRRLLTSMQELIPGKNSPV